jgi:hypothetical protein
VTLQDVIDAEIKRGKLQADHVHLDGVDPRNDILHHEWCFVRCVNTTEPQLSVIMIVELSKPVIHVLPSKLMCRWDDQAREEHGIQWIEYLKD